MRKQLIPLPQAGYFLDPDTMAIQVRYRLWKKHNNQSDGALAEMSRILPAALKLIGSQYILHLEEQRYYRASSVSWPPIKPLESLQVLTFTYTVTHRDYQQLKKHYKTDIPFTSTFLQVLQTHLNRVEETINMVTQAILKQIYDIELMTHHEAALHVLHGLVYRDRHIERSDPIKNLNEVLLEKPSTTRNEPPEMIVEVADFPDFMDTSESITQWLREAGIEYRCAIQLLSKPTWNVRGRNIAVHLVSIAVQTDSEYLPTVVKLFNEHGYYSRIIPVLQGRSSGPVLVPPFHMARIKQHVIPTNDVWRSLPLSISKPDQVPIDTTNDTSVGLLTHEHELYRLQPNALIIGPEGSGKTALRQVLQSQWIKDNNSQIVAIEFDPDSKQYTDAYDGEYHNFVKDTPLPLSPFQYLETNEDKSAALQCIIKMGLDSRIAGKNLLIDVMIQAIEQLSLIEDRAARRVSHFVELCHRSNAPFGRMLTKILVDYTDGGKWSALFDEPEEGYQWARMTTLLLHTPTELNNEGYLIPYFHCLLHRILRRAREDRKAILFSISDIWRLEEIHTSLPLTEFLRIARRYSLAWVFDDEPGIPKGSDTTRLRDALAETAASIIFCPQYGAWSFDADLYRSFNVPDHDIHYLENTRSGSYLIQNGSGTQWVSFTPATLSST